VDQSGSDEAHMPVTMACDTATVRQSSMMKRVFSTAANPRATVAQYIMASTRISLAVLRKAMAATTRILLSPRKPPRGYSKLIGRLRLLLWPSRRTRRPIPLIMPPKKQPNMMTRCLGMGVILVDEEEQPKERGKDPATRAQKNALGVIRLYYSVMGRVVVSLDKRARV